MFNYNIMDLTIDLAKKAGYMGEIPVAAIIIENLTNKIIARATNLVENLKDPTAHAEILAIRKACRKINSMRISNCSIYINLEPCTMCMEAIKLARINKIYFGAYNKNKSVSTYPDIYCGIRQKESETILIDFFNKMRKDK